MFDMYAGYHFFGMREIGKSVACHNSPNSMEFRRNPAPNAEYMPKMQNHREN